MNASHEQNQLFPVFLKLSSKSVLIVGGGKIALEKLNTLLRNSPEAWIYVVAPEISSKIKQVAGKSRTVFLWNEKFREIHLDGIDIVITATGNRKLSELIKQQASARKIWVNTADVPDLCDFYLGGVVSRGHLKIAVSTNGKSPVMARRWREVLEESIPAGTELSIEQLHELRTFLQGDFAQRVATLNKTTQVLLQKKKKKGPAANLKTWLVRKKIQLNGLFFIHF
jgi:siroheme synthase-like protein